MPLVTTFKELRVYQNAMDLAMTVFYQSKGFPSDERFLLVDQFRRASRSVGANISESCRKRRYVAAFRSKINDAEGEACECQSHCEIARRCGYISDEVAREIDARYEEILSQLAAMFRDAESWCRNFGA